jgi:NAD(P)-dependent dehydrogenase (short-subunit alcohol dehydrogenase family)
VAVVTGAGRGLGRAYALELARLGAAVVVNDVGAGPTGHGASGEPADEVVRLVRDQDGSAHPHHGSITDAGAVDGLLAAALREFGHVDMLVNNAGILRNSFLLQLAEEDWDAVVDVNLKGTFLTLQRFGRYWREQHKLGHRRRPAVVNTTSAAGLQGTVQQANYVAAKAGVAMLTIAAAAELERYDVRVNAVAPLARTRLTIGGTGDRGRHGRHGDRVGSGARRTRRGLAAEPALPVHRSGLRRPWRCGGHLPRMGHRRPRPRRRPC